MSSGKRTPCNVLFVAANRTWADRFGADGLKSSDGRRLLAGRRFKPPSLRPARGRLRTATG